MNAICGLDWRNLSQIDEKKIINQMAIAEQFIGQYLQTSPIGKRDKYLCPNGLLQLTLVTSLCGVAHKGENMANGELIQEADQG